jgi:LPS export ABC transporter protein LptC
MRHLLISIFSLSIIACSNGLEKNTTFEKYDGPIMEADSVKILYSDSAKVRVIVKATKQNEFENGDREFPNDIFIEFYEPDGTMSSTLEANSAFYTKETNLYKAEGDVEVIGYIEPRTLNSEELYWEPEKEEIYTETFVRIQSEDQISTGTGLRAKQDFSSYRILNPSGTIYLDDKPTTEESEAPNEKTENNENSKFVDKKGKPAKKPIKLSNGLKKDLSEEQK